MVNTLLFSLISDVVVSVTVVLILDLEHVPRYNYVCVFEWGQHTKPMRNKITQLRSGL